MQPVHQPIARPVFAGAMLQVDVGWQNLALEVAELVEAFTAPERRLASPVGDLGNGCVGIACGTRVIDESPPVCPCLRRLSVQSPAVRLIFTPAPG